MRTVIALLRGVNVGGRGRLPMGDLVALLQGLDLHDVATCLQSGNAVFRVEAEALPDLAARIRTALARHRDLDVTVVLLDRARLETVVADNPFPEAVAAPATLHVNLLAARPSAPDLEGLEKLRRDDERFVLGDRVLYLHAPRGIARSRLVAGAERRLGVPMTGRNWRTVMRILQLARQLDARA